MPYFSTADGISLHYTDEGHGLPVLTLAGLTRNSADFDYVAPHLGDVRLIRLDYRGRGKSGWAEPETYTIPVEANDALALLDHLDIPAAAIIGTSRGGLIGMGLAAHAAPRVIGLVLNDIGPAIEPAGLDAIRAYIGRNPVDRTFADAAATRARALTGFTGVPKERWLSEVRKLYTETDDGLVINYDPRLRDAVLANPASVAPDLWPVFDAIGDIPLALVRGARSNILSAETANEMLRRRPDMIQTVLANRGHVPFLDEPPALAVLEQWLAALSSQHGNA